MYQVKSTDTLAGIALQFSMQRHLLKQYNRLSSDKLIPGTILWVKKRKRLSLSQSLDSPDGITQSTPTTPSISITPVMLAQPTIASTTSKCERSPPSLDKRSWNHASRFQQIPKDQVLREELMCFTKNKRVQGQLTLTPYQLIFQSHERLPTIQIYTDYGDIISCKLFSSRWQWLEHLSKDWQREKQAIHKKMKNSVVDEEHERFIQSEIARLNEIEDAKAKMTVNATEVKQVETFPCIYVLVYQDKHIQTLFFRGVDGSRVDDCFHFLKNLTSECKNASPYKTSPNLQPVLVTPNTLMLSSSSSSSSTSAEVDKMLLLSPLDMDPQDSYSPKLIANGNGIVEDILLTSELFKKLRHFLPATRQRADIKLEYNSINDGVSFGTFYRLMEHVEQCLLLVKDDGGHVFGVYCSDTIRPRSSYYGGGETFMFTLLPELQVFKWTKENDMFLQTSHEYLAVGGGSMFGLWMDADFDHGFSGTCETFNNTTLSHRNDFVPLVVECWSVN
ncbi:hypothetical protein SAMD00019534_016680 [Acytostelium subglobosum LB1]|uniref:hypothetical protein n=1 Tax=Acytostelium subglobosum LB1 TaxID=1410327 RepID=UPI00064506FB|nr:hypothetical protein SAMD00019534_016680 [Acytostelium subglobosum LB1]GAM18493.1 hypothetical protein SAMD00019534_016680 [Acytostelium subglobosum LB1]|eukprot:XP_012757713.1 hypothetical protein SAMD00019534_016680 [Acytostelium subglobosum LB1]